MAYERKDGFIVINNTEEHEPEGDVWEENGVYINRSLIPYTYTSSTIVHFVSGNNGDEFGQFPTLEAAIEKAELMASFPPEIRRAFDQ